MRFFHQPPAQSLAEWLGTATRGLVPLAQARIRAEIEAHCAEAGQAHLASGLTETEAQAATLAELGSAQAANWRFRQKHLTLLNVSEIRASIKLDRSKRRLGFFLSFSFISALVLWIMQPPSATVPLWLLLTIWQLWWLVWFALAFRAYVLAGRPLTPPTLRQIACLRVVRCLHCGVGYLVLFWGTRLSILRATADNPYMDLYTLIVMGIFVVEYAASCLTWLQVRRKLMTAGDDWSEPPSHSTTAA